MSPPSVWLLLTAVLLFALNLRGPIVAVAPVIDLIQADLNMNATVAGLLTSLPVLCFAVATPFSAGIIARAGPERAVALALIGVLVGTAVRSAGGSGLALLGTAIMGTAITVGNVVVPVIIHRDFPPRRTSIATGAYTAALNVGSMIASIATVPLAGVVGWRIAIAAGVVFIAFAAIASSKAFGWGAGRPAESNTGRSSRARPPKAAEPAVSEERIRPTRSLTAWVLTFTFGAQAFSYYGVTAWLPALLSDRAGMEMAGSGASSSIFQILAVVGALGVPALARFTSARSILILLVSFWFMLSLGLIFAPHAWAVWLTFGGIAQGGVMTLVFITIIKLARNGRHARGLSAMVQGGGYAIGATGPSVLGAIHDLTNGWVVPMVCVCVAVTIILTGGVISTVRSETRKA